MAFHRLRGPAWCGFDSHRPDIAEVKSEKGKMASRKAWMIERILVLNFSLILFHLAFALVPWSSGDDTWPTSRERWFDSIRDQSWSAGVLGGTPLS